MQLEVKEGNEGKPFSCQSVPINVTNHQPWAEIHKVIRSVVSQHTVAFQICQTRLYLRVWLCVWLCVWGCMCCTQLFPHLKNNRPVCLSQQQRFLKSAGLSRGNTLALTHSLKSKMSPTHTVSVIYVYLYMCCGCFSPFRFADLCQLCLCKVGHQGPGLLHLRQSHRSHRGHHHRPGEDRTRC